MTPHIATPVLQAIHTAITADQGAAFRGWEKRVFPHMDDAYRSEKEDGFRTHLGASLLGDKCARSLWYGFRWFTKPSFDARTLRLFNRGHLEEARFVAMLLTIGVEVFQQDSNGKQFRISELGGHLGGSGDGVGMNVPGIHSSLAVLLEFKTHNDTSFQKLAGKSWRKYHESLLTPGLPRVEFDGEGVRSAKFQHYVQMTSYMRKMDLPLGLYMAVNKNDDDIYAEFVPRDDAMADGMLARGRKVIMMREPPDKLNKSPGWFDCKFCNHRPVCHLGHPPERNCRTCVHSYAVEDGRWVCNVPTQPDGGGAGVVLDKAAQLAGCNQYESIK